MAKTDNPWAGLHLWMVKTEDHNGNEDGGNLWVLTRLYDAAAAGRKAQSYLNEEKEGRRILVISNEGTIDA